MLANSISDYMVHLRSRGIQFLVNGTDLHVWPKKLLTDADRLKIRERKAEILASIALLPSQRPNPWLDRWRRVYKPWKDDDADLIDWFRLHRDQFICKPYLLFSFARISDPEKFYSALERDIQAGSDSPRAVGLRCELNRLRELSDSIKTLSLGAIL
jgi:hypothetical protein